MNQFPLVPLSVRSAARTHISKLWAVPGTLRNSFTVSVVIGLALTFTSLAIDSGTSPSGNAPLKELGSRSDNLDASVAPQTLLLPEIYQNLRRSLAHLQLTRDPPLWVWPPSKLGPRIHRKITPLHYVVC